MLAAPGKPTSFRLSPEGRDLLEILEDHYGLKKTAVLELVIREHIRKVFGEQVPKKKRRKPPTPS